MLSPITSVEILRCHQCLIATFSEDAPTQSQPPMPLANAPYPWHPCYLHLQGFFHRSQQWGNAISADIFHNQSAESCIIEISRCSLETVVRNPSLKSHKVEIFLPIELCMCSTCIQQVFTCACFSNTSFL